MGLLSNAMRRLGGAIPIRSAGRDIELLIDGNGSINWQWAKEGLDRVSDLSPRQINTVMNDVADRTVREVQSRFPRQYSFMSYSPGHGRRYARDIERRLAGTGYRSEHHPSPIGMDVYLLRPELQAYLNYFGRQAPEWSGDALNASAVGAGLYGLYGASRE